MGARPEIRWAAAPLPTPTWGCADELPFPVSLASGALAGSDRAGMVSMQDGESSRMTFDRREWVSDMIAASITGAIAGMIGAIFVPDPPFAIAVAAGGIAGFATGLVNLPLKRLLDWRPRKQVPRSVKGATDVDQPPKQERSQTNGG